MVRNTYCFDLFVKYIILDISIFPLFIYLLDCVFPVNDIFM